MPNKMKRRVGPRARMPHRPTVGRGERGEGRGERGRGLGTCRGGGAGLGVGGLVARRALAKRRPNACLKIRLPHVDASHKTPQVEPRHLRHRMLE